MTKPPVSESATIAAPTSLFVRDAEGRTAGVFSDVAPVPGAPGVYSAVNQGTNQQTRLTSDQLGLTHGHGRTAVPARQYKAVGGPSAARARTR